MMRELLICAVLTGGGFLGAQGQGTSPAQASGTCTVAASGSGNTITITNCGLGDEQTKQIVTILNKILRNQVSPAAVNEKLDEIIASMRKAQTSRPTITQQNTGGCNQQVVGGSYNTNNCAAPPEITASAQSLRQTGDPSAPWVTEFTMQTSALAQTGNLRLTCTGPVLKAGIRTTPNFSSRGANGPDPHDPDTVIYELGPEILSPGQIVQVMVFSSQPVTVNSGSIGSNTIHFPAQ